jgi:ribosomal protein L37AE/L43A
LTREPVMTAKRKERNCPDCGVGPGEVHALGCDVEQCAKCGGQLLGCGHRPKSRLPWTGIWPGVEECREYGFFAVLMPGIEWQPCHPDAPDAHPDINRLASECRWDSRARRFFRV